MRHAACEIPIGVIEILALSQQFTRGLRGRDESVQTLRYALGILATRVCVQIGAVLRSCVCDLAILLPYDPEEFARFLPVVTGFLQ